MSTNDATDNQFSNASPEVINHDSIPAASSSAGGDTPRTFSRQLLSGNTRGIQQFGSPNLFADSGNNYFGVSKNNVQQVLMGLQPTFGEGFYVTKDGIDASQTTSTDDFIFNSNQDVFKIIEVVTIKAPAYTTLTVPMGQVALDVHQTSYTHNLGFSPVAIGVLPNTESIPSYYPVPRTVYGFSTDNIRYAAVTTGIFTSSTQVIFEINTFLSAIGAAGSFTANIGAGSVKIFLLQETAA